MLITDSFLPHSAIQDEWRRLNSSVCLTAFVSHWLQESACVKVVAAVSMWDVCMEKGHRDLEQFEKVHRYISDQLFTNFVSDSFFNPLFIEWLSSWGS